jgi:hypothetical protein
VIAAEAARLGDGPGSVIAGGLIMLAFGAGGIWHTRTWRNLARSLGFPVPAARTRFDRAYGLAGHVVFGTFVALGVGWTVFGVGRLLLSLV